MVTSRILFTAKQKDELWERWKNGQSVFSLSSVAFDLGESSSGGALASG